MRERDSEPGRKIPETEVTIKPLGDSGLRRPYPGITFFIIVSFPHAACSSALDTGAAGSIETSVPNVPNNPS